MDALILDADLIICAIRITFAAISGNTDTIDADRSLFTIRFTCRINDAIPVQALAFVQTACRSRQAAVRFTTRRHTIAVNAEASFFACRIACRAIDTFVDDTHLIVATTFGTPGTFRNALAIDADFIVETFRITDIHHTGNACIVGTDCTSFAQRFACSIVYTLTVNADLVILACGITAVIRIDTCSVHTQT